MCVRHHCAGPPRSPRKWRQFRRSEPPRDGEGGRGGGRKGRGRKRDAGKREQNRGRVGNKSDINLNFRMSARKSWIGAGPPSLVREARQGQRRRRRQGWSSANPRNPRGPPKDYVYVVLSSTDTPLCSAGPQVGPFHVRTAVSPEKNDWNHRPNVAWDF